MDFASRFISNNEEKLAKKIINESTCDGGKTTAFQATIDTLMMQDSKGRKGDFQCDREDEGVACLSAMIKNKKIKISMAPLRPFGASEQDLVRVLVKWCYKESTGYLGSSNRGGKYNISKACRRLEDYVEWMEKNCKGFDFRPETMKEAYDAWGFFVNHDKDGRLVWWADCDLNKYEKIKSEIPYDDTLRYFTYLSHLFMFDTGAQKHGMVCVDQMGNKSVVDYFTMIPVELGTKLDRISVGILPVKVKKLYMYNCARWMWVIAGLMAPFASPKMRKRVVFVRGNPQKRIEQDFGIENIPKQMVGIRGKAETDILAQLFSSRRNMRSQRHPSTNITKGSSGEETP